MADSKKGRKVGNHKKHCEAYKSALKQVIGYLTPRRAQVINALTA